MTLPLLSIAIPTYNRAPYLALTLAHLRSDMASLPAGLVEVIVSDNASGDHTAEVVAAAIAGGLPVHALRNPKNIGSDANIAQVFNLARGRYVLILGDDDVLTEGTLGFLVNTLKNETYGVICLKPYGYNSDIKGEHPGKGGENIVYKDSGDFLASVASYVTLISACVINKALLEEVDARAFCGGNLVQVHLVIRAALEAPTNLYRTIYSVACKRNNSGGYDFAHVFVQELGDILDRYRPEGMTAGKVRKFETRMMLGFYPYYLLRQRRDRSGDLATTYRYFTARFHRRLLFWTWLMPIMKLPRLASLAWGGAAVLIGRLATGDFRRGLKFLLAAMAQRLWRPGT
ncbi:glycosyltransferase family 2 protein [Rhizobium sp. SAFR-030]|uniref:glycosyltransferase family 2 protein n=1 Tax=Rhizobium sp. SAFR-030 TaxID=3387277 RepID=UPI003F7E9320